MGSGLDRDLARAEFDDLVPGDPPSVAAAAQALEQGAGADAERRDLAVAAVDFPDPAETFAVAGAYPRAVKLRETYFRLRCLAASPWLFAR